MSSEPDGEKSTPEPAPAKVQAEAYPEHDKLGPLPSAARSLSLAQGADLRAAVIAVFRDGVERARRAADDARGDLDGAVHEYRKALRRARAIHELVADTLPGDDGDAVRDALRHARRAVSSSRDHAVVPKALASLELQGDVHAAAEAVLAAARDATPARDAVLEHLTDGAAAAVLSADVVAANLPVDLGVDVLLDGIAATYRAARRQLADARRSRRAVHAWRRRTKELSYQLELLAEAAGARTAALAKDVAELSDQLGDVVDLVMLEAFIAEHGADVESEAGDALCAIIGDALRDRTRAARRRGKAVFDRGGRRFARRLAKAIRRDLAPADPEPAIESDDVSLLPSS